MKKNKKILLIIQRSNGDVFFINSIVYFIKKNFIDSEIDLLVNKDTISTASLIPNIRNILTFSYDLKKTQPLRQEISILSKIFRKYDISANFTSSDRSVIYSFLSGKISISAVEGLNRKSWWKKLILSHHYEFNNQHHIIENNFKVLDILKINYERTLQSVPISTEDKKNVLKKLASKNIDSFLIFHPCAQYEYKTLPKSSVIELLKKLNTLNLKIIVTGGNSDIDNKIKQYIPELKNIYNFIGKLSLGEYIYLSEISLAYIGMDTLNMHVASSQGKRVFAIFGPTNLRMWSPWSNLKKEYATKDMVVQTYGLNTIFQSDLPCVACGKAGCEDSHKLSPCMENISLDDLFEIIHDEFRNV